MNTHVRKAIMALGHANPTEEVGGLIVYGPNRVKEVQCTSVLIGADRMHNWEMSTDDYVAATKLGAPCAIWHTHVEDAAAFTEEDLDVANEIELPSHIYSVRDGKWATYIPKTYRAWTVGAPFAWGERDCYETLRIHYRQELGIYLPDYDRDESFRILEPSAIMDRIVDAGFIQIGNDWSVVRPHDALVFNTDGRRFPHHIGVFVGKSRLLHHPYGGLSRIDDLDARWLDKLVCICRHTSQFIAS